jgi:hypothetical protein
MSRAGTESIFISAGRSTARFATLPPYEPYEDEKGVKHVGTNGGEQFEGPPPAPACYARGSLTRVRWGRCC